MMLREVATLRTGGGTDENGDPLPYVDTAIRAAFTPMTAEESVALGRAPSSVSYRMTFQWPDVLPAETEVTWRGKVYGFVGPSQLLTMSGQIHHQEAIVTRATG